MSRGPSWREGYDDGPAVIYTLDENLHFLRCNPAWDRFASQNGAPELTCASVFGTSIMDVVPAVLRDFYTAAYGAVLGFRREWWHIFDCSSAAMVRSFQMHIMPGDPWGLVVINTLLREEPSGEADMATRLEEYTDADGIVTMCAHCRRVEHLAEPGRWDLVPYLLSANQALVKPGLCDFCFAYHYPGRPR